MQKFACLLSAVVQICRQATYTGLRVCVAARSGTKSSRAAQGRTGRALTSGPTSVLLLARSASSQSARPVISPRSAASGPTSGCLRASTAVMATSCGNRHTACIHTLCGSLSCRYSGRQHRMSMRRRRRTKVLPVCHNTAESAPCAAKAQRSPKARATAHANHQTKMGMMCGCTRFRRLCCPTSHAIQSRSGAHSRSLTPTVECASDEPSSHACKTGFCKDRSSRSTHLVSLDVLQC